MRTPSANAYPARLRKLLRANPDGMTVGDLCAAIGCERGNKTVYAALHRMPDAYIDRWNRSAIWCVVVPPEHCPRPTR